MKLEKREITLNEADSLKDVYYLEKILISEYERVGKYAERKEIFNEFENLLKETKADCEKVLSLWEKSKEEQI